LPTGEVLEAGIGCVRDRRAIGRTGRTRNAQALDRAGGGGGSGGGHAQHHVSNLVGLLLGGIIGRADRQFGLDQDAVARVALGIWGIRI
jgi:hypothetical protein